VRQQVNFLEQQVDPTMLKQLFTKELLEEMRRLSYPEAITRIKRKIALDEIIKREGLQVDQVQLKEKVDNAMEYFREQGQSQTIDRKKLIAVVTEEILTENALDWLVENSEIELVAEGSLAEKAQPPQISETEVAPDGTVTIEATASDAE
jgi:trigger factor